MIRRPKSLLIVSIALVTVLVGCSDDGGDSADTTTGSEPRTVRDALDQAAEQDDRFTEITEPAGDGPLIGEEDGEEVRVSDAQVFCDGYWRVSDYRDQLFNLLDREDLDLLTSHVTGTGPSAEEAASDLRLGISGGMDLDMRPWVFVVDSQEWIRKGYDLATIRERAEDGNADLEGFDRAYAEIC